jgi:ATP adenylyltransferase
VNTFKSLADFIQRRMRMSHVYQPVMLMTLLNSGGRCHQRKIAAALLAHDESQIEYYTLITNRMVGKVLRNHGLVARDERTKEYELRGFDSLTATERKELVALCKQRLDAFVAARGAAIYQHRHAASGYVPGTIRYEVLKRARFRCELCGISADEKALEVDHINPRNRGGLDDVSNYQALCYSCNATKRDRDDTDFRHIAASYSERHAGCLFCEVPQARVIAENALAYAIRDAYPVTNLHTLIIPKRHAVDYFALGQAEINGVTALLKSLQDEVRRHDPSVAGFNIGMNNGETAGQSVMHCHVHLIPRRPGDVPKPKGGVRNVIPGKGDY